MEENSSLDRLADNARTLSALRETSRTASDGVRQNAERLAGAVRSDVRFSRDVRKIADIEAKDDLILVHFDNDSMVVVVEDMKVYLNSHFVCDIEKGDFGFDIHLDMTTPTGQFTEKFANGVMRVLAEQIDREVKRLQS